MARNSNSKNTARSFFIIIMLALICGVLLMSVIRLYKKNKSSRETRQQYEEQYDELQAKKDTLESKLEAVQSDRGIEAELRSRYDVVKEGEQMIKVIDEKRN